MSATLTLDLFGAPSTQSQVEPAPRLVAQIEALEPIEALPTQETFVEAVALPGGRPLVLPPFNHHAHAFAAVARHCGVEHPGLTPLWVSPIGSRHLDLPALSRLANGVLRGVESDRPALTPERWREAAQKIFDQRGVRP